MTMIETVEDTTNTNGIAPPAAMSETLSRLSRGEGLRALQKRFKLPNLMAILLYELLTDELKSGEELVAAGINHPQLSIQRLRRTLGITIVAKRYTGYWIAQSDRDRLVRELDG